MMTTSTKTLAAGLPLIAIDIHALLWFLCGFIVAQIVNFTIRYLKKYVR